MQAQYQAFLCLIGFGANTSGPSCRLLVLNAFHHAIPGHFAFHFIQTSQKTNQDGCHLSHRLGIDQSIQGATA